MNIRDLKYLAALSEHKHFGKAALSCFVSQPALSMQIKKLEETLDVQLIERHHKSVVLTDIGALLAERARALVIQAEEIKKIVQLSKDPASGELKIGVIPTIAPYLLPYIIPKLSKSFPKVEFYLIEEQTSLLIEKLNQGKIDAAFLALPLDEKKYAVTKLYEEEFLLAVHKTHELAKLKKIKLEHLKNRNFFLLEEGHCMRDSTLEICHRADVSENSHFRATSLETLRYMVIANAGITLMPKLACKKHAQLCYIPFETLKSSRHIALASRLTTPRKNLLTEISLQIKSILKHYSLVKIK